MADLVATPRVLDRAEDAKGCAGLAQKVKVAFNDKLVTGARRVGTNTPTAYMLPPTFDPDPEEVRPPATGRPAEDIRQAQYHLGTALGRTPDLCHVLSRYRHADAAYKLLTQESYPLWLYAAKKGAQRFGSAGTVLNRTTAFRIPP